MCIQEVKECPFLCSDFTMKIRHDTKFLRSLYYVYCIDFIFFLNIMNIYLSPFIYLFKTMFISYSAVNFSKIKAIFSKNRSWEVRTYFFLSPPLLSSFLIFFTSVELFAFTSKVVKLELYILLRIH